MLGCERDVPLKDIWQYVVHHFQEIEQHCGLCPVKFKQGDVLQQKSFCSEEELLCACGQQLLRKEEPKHLKVHCNHVNMSWPLEVLERLSEEHI